MTAATHANLAALIRRLRDDARAKRLEATREVKAADSARLYGLALGFDESADRIEAEMRTVDKE